MSIIQDVIAKTKEKDPAQPEGSSSLPVQRVRGGGRIPGSLAEIGDRYCPRCHGQGIRGQGSADDPRQGGVVAAGGGRGRRNGDHIGEHAVRSMQHAEVREIPTASCVLFPVSCFYDPHIRLQKSRPCQ